MEPRGAGFVVVAGLLRWFTTTYRITADQVQVRKGLLRRRLLTVPRDRIRTVDVTANALHRALGLAKVEVGTGRTDRKDEAVKLDALHAAEAGRLRGELLHRVPARSPSPGAPPGGRAGAATETGEPRETVLARVPAAWIRYGPFTLSGLVTVGVIAGVAGRAINEAHLDPGRLGPLSSAAGPLGARRRCPSRSRWSRPFWWWRSRSPRRSDTCWRSTGSG